MTHGDTIRTAAARQFGTALTEVASPSFDGTVLRGWYLQPTTRASASVILLHGVGDNREGMAGYAGLFLARGYGVLLPDSRAHGESGGEIATYGVRERYDLQRWVSWLYARRGTECVYALGESMGAAATLEALAMENRFCAVAVESPFSSFRAVALDRVGAYIGLGPWFGRTLGRGPVEFAFAYTRWRYGVDLTGANPVDGVRNSPTPVLLIHGTADTNILPWHSQALAAADKNAMLWLVPRAVHTGAWAAAPDQFERRVLDWFSSHSDKAITRKR